MGGVQRVASGLVVYDIRRVPCRPPQRPTSLLQVIRRGCGWWWWWWLFGVIRTMLWCSGLQYPVKFRPQKASHPPLVSNVVQGGRLVWQTFDGVVGHRYVREWYTESISHKYSIGPIGSMRRTGDPMLWFLTLHSIDMTDKQVLMFNTNISFHGPNCFMRWLLCSDSFVTQCLVPVRWREITFYKSFYTPLSNPPS